MGHRRRGPDLCRQKNRSERDHELESPGGEAHESNRNRWYAHRSFRATRQSRPNSGFWLGDIAQGGGGLRGSWVRVGVTVAGVLFLGQAGFPIVSLLVALVRIGVVTTRCPVSPRC